jgi:hypothetical protein
MDDEYLKYHVSVITDFKNHEIVKCDLVYGYISNICSKIDKNSFYCSFVRK